MTPKEKAQDLFYRCPIVELGDDNGVVKNDLSIKALKDVIIFLVDEILLECNDWFWQGVRKEYFEQVKEEIEKL